ncbi:hypothetical protein E3P81_02884 [Wallemia ichthyophaga]|nr:hypothetical protein E3P97_02939 [Wallemia ichthyophaga]TIB05258.1 hypothetical protein E3P96_01274 [Wallemia ichthyophaga]TIB30746.1 hypothetical protein E3P85_02582 [Wallemia ichthyophaga]TIB45356.1 hypothetical protein E3P82_02885 [Wallemia ichthyophaga]TIB48457.1 hypothetical protein E3P81_02884 [Wallemia ichthyophaga]
MKNLFKKRTQQQNQQSTDNKEEIEQHQHHIASAVRAALIPPKRGSLYNNLGGMNSDTSPIIPVDQSNKNSSNENVNVSSKADKHASNFSSQPSNSPRISDVEHHEQHHEQHSDTEVPHGVPHTDHPPNYSEELESEQPQPQNNQESIREQPLSPENDVLAPPDLSTFSPIPRVSTPKGLSLPTFSPFNPLAQPPPPIRDQFISHATPPTSPRDVRRAARQLPTLARGSADPSKPPSSTVQASQSHENAETAEASELEDIDSEDSFEDDDGEDEQVEQYRRPSAPHAPTTDYFSLPPSNALVPPQTPRAIPISPGANGTPGKSSSVLPPKLNQRTASSVTVQQRSRQNTQSTLDDARPSEDSAKEGSRSPEALRRLTSSIMLTSVDSSPPPPQPKQPLQPTQPTQTSIPNRTTSHKDVTQLNKDVIDEAPSLAVASTKTCGRQMSRSLTDLSSFQSPQVIEGLGVGLNSPLNGEKDITLKGKERAQVPSSPVVEVDDLVQSSSSTREIGVGTSPPTSPATAHSAQMEQERRNWKEIFNSTPLSPPPPITPLPAHGTPNAAKRRLSLPNMMVAPPQYDEVALRETIFGGIRRIIRPREEEGREKLPKYKCGIHIEGLMPRKMEFTSPGNQARDRTWRRVYVVLHGTVLKIYKADKWDHGRALLSSEINDLNEADVESAYVHEPPPADAPIPPVPALPQLLAQRPSFQNHINAPANNVKYAPTLLRKYSLQNAESGLAADYVKRRNVIRVRLLSDKGVKEQFLIQAYDQSSVIDWIESSSEEDDVLEEVDAEMAHMQVEHPEEAVDMVRPLRNTSRSLRQESNSRSRSRSRSRSKVRTVKAHPSLAALWFNRSCTTLDSVEVILPDNVYREKLVDHPQTYYCMATEPPQHKLDLHVGDHVSRVENDEGITVCDVVDETLNTINYIIMNAGVSEDGEVDPATTLVIDGRLKSIHKFRHNGYLPLPITQASVKNNATKLLAIPVLLLLLIVYTYKGNGEVKEIYKLIVVGQDESHEVFSSSNPPNSASRAVRPIKFHQALPDLCVDEWIGAGIWGEHCKDVDIKKFSTIDPVFPWVNGSDPVQISALQAFSDQKVDSQHRYQEHDELRYALRSIERSVGQNVGQYHILASSYDSPEGGNQIAQHPFWLNDHEKVEMHHHFNFFRRMPTIPESQSLTDDQLNNLNAEWRAASLPTFNSFAIEGQMHNIDAQSDTIVYHNDDFFTLKNNEVSDYYSPLHGPVLRSLSYSMYVPQEKPLGSRNGEGVAIARSSWVLGRRFGMRWRPYIAHHARSLSLPILNEAAIMFDNSFNNVTLARFRNTKDAPWAIQSFFFASWFITERHREALLWSWIVGKWGASNQVIDTDKMWSELTGGESLKHQVYVPHRVTVEDEELEKTLNNAHIPKPLNTEYAFSSMDGYGPGYLRQIWHRLLSRHGWPDLRDDKRLKACTITKEQCFKQGSTAEELFKHIAFEQYGDCGDCSKYFRNIPMQLTEGLVITQLISQGGSKGLEIFLPPKDSLKQFSGVPNLPLNDDWHDADFKLNTVLDGETSPRSFAARLIMRYNHVFGETPSQFTKVYNPSQLKQQLDMADTHQDTTFICLNDDVKKEKDIPAINELMGNWFTSRWPEPEEWERV